MIYLRPKQEYIDRYDRITVEDCRRLENFHKNYDYSEKNPEASKESLQALAEIPLHYDLLFTTLRWSDKKDHRIEEWMVADKRKDEMLANAHAPKDIRCLKCRALLTPDDGEIHDLDGQERVLFFYTCPNECLPHRVIFENGEEWKKKPHLCPKCQATLDEKREREDEDEERIVITKTCPSCDYTDTFDMELGDHKEVSDPDYEKDRECFCLSGERGAKAREERLQLEQIKEFVDEWKEKDGHKEDYDAVEKIQKLTVIELEKLLGPILEKEAYTRLQFGTPEITKDVFLPFTIYDSKSGRNERTSSYDLARAIKKALADTNWRLMSDGISYRLGVLTGRLRAYEREEDLLNLVRIKKDQHEKEETRDEDRIRIREA